MKPRRTKILTKAEYKGYKIVQTPYIVKGIRQYELITYDRDGEWLFMTTSSKSLKHNKLRLMLIRDVKFHERISVD